MFRLLANLGIRIRRNEAGSLSVEFALLAPAFLILLFGIIESGLMLFNSIIMEGAAQEAARQVRTGVVQSSGDPETTFKTLLCDNLFSVVSCASLTYVVETYPSFTSSNMTSMFDANGNIRAASYADTEPGDVVVVRVAMNWTFITPLISYAYGTDRMQLISTVVFRNEPFNPAGI
ncbi:MAG: pilus assembly protein [Rhodospirillales bacterium]|nr:pilus assembly protein [Rhodospirillales bacterium]